jgi:hypothetical protein
VAVLVLVGALIAGCTSTSTPKHVATQPAFTRTPASQSAAEAATPVSTTSSLTADYSKTGGSVDKSMLLNGSQGGYAPMKNLNWLPAQAAQLSSMGLHDVRIDHIFDDAYYHVINVDAAGAVTYNFADLDRVVLPLVRNGMTPFFSLSYAPSVTGAAVYRAPTSNAAWAAATTALVAHYKALGLTGLNWEVWNEIDSLYTYTGTLEQYEALYVATVKAVKAGDSTAKVGGAATSTIGVVGGWSSRFLSYLGAHPSVPADFFSYHSYYIGDFSDLPTAQAWLKATGRNIPIYITEWNSNPSFGLGVGKGSDTNSSTSGSSYVAKRLFTAIGAGAAKIFWFGPVEGADPSKAYSGDLGLVTVDGHRKSVGNVFEMYSKLDSIRVTATVTGAGSATKDVYGVVTKDDKSKKTTVLLWNNTASDSDMAVSLDHLPFGKSNFEVSQTLVSDHKGNGFADTSTTVDYRYPSPNENAPVVSDSVQSPSSTFSRTVSIPAHGVTELTLTASKAPKGRVAINAQPAAVDLAASAAGATASASSSSAEIPAAGWGTANVIDGRRHTVTWAAKGAEGWSSAAHPTANATEHVQVDLGSSKAVESVVLWPRDSTGHEGEGFPADFTISGSADGKSWTTLSTSRNYRGSSTIVGPQTFGFAPGTYRFLKVTATKLAHPTTESGAPVFHFQLGEFEAYRTGIPNAGFESKSLTPWVAHGGAATVQSKVVHGGSEAVNLTGSTSSIDYAISGLKPGTTYTFGGYVRSSSAGGSVTLTAGSKSSRVASNEWSPGWVTFTTDKAATTATLSVARTGSGTAWVDDLTLTSGSGQ